MPLPMRLVLLLAVLLVSAGCTDQMWRSANEPTVRAYRLVGLTAVDAAGNRAIVVEYRPTWSDKPSFLTVPADAGGQPRPPFRPATRPSLIAWADVSPPQRAAIVSTAGAVGSSAGITVPVARHGGVEDSGLGTATDQTLWAVAYRIDAAGCLIAEPFTYDGHHGGSGIPVVPAGCQVLFVPVDRPRPAADRDADRVRAALLTPITVVVDVPLYVFYGVVVCPYAMIYTDFGRRSGC